MAWGGSLNKDGSDHLRNLREADKVLKFLEELKQDVSKEEEEAISTTINIIVNHYNKKSDDDFEA